MFPKTKNFLEPQKMVACGFKTCLKSKKKVLKNYVKFSPSLNPFKVAHNVMFVEMIKFSQTEINTEIPDT